LSAATIEESERLEKIENDQKNDPNPIRLLASLAINDAIDSKLVLILRRIVDRIFG